MVVDEAALADPGPVVTRLHEAWSGREPIVIELAVDPARFRAPVDHHDEPWLLGPGFEPWWDRLHFLVWANSYDAQAPGRAGVVVGPQGRPPGRRRGGAGPAGRRGAARRHAGVGRRWPAVTAGAERRRAPRRPPRDGRAGPPRAVARRRSTRRRAGRPTSSPRSATARGPARIVAPAGSGKTRVLTERLRHLLVRPRLRARGGARGGLQRQGPGGDERAPPGLGARIQTLNALGLRRCSGGLRDGGRSCSTSARCARSSSGWSPSSSAGSTPTRWRPTSTACR